MTPIRAVAVLAALAWGAVGCSSSPSIDGARQSWKQTVKTCPTYHYAITDSPVFQPLSRTTIVISDGQPIARGYVESQYVGSQPEVTASWIEQAGHVGEHTQGRPAKTMEQLQDDCASSVLVQDRTMNEVKFSSDDRGVLLECWYYPNGCSDCSRGGVVIEDFACGTLVLGDGGAPDAGDGGTTNAEDAREAGAPQEAGAAATDADASEASADGSCAPNALFVCVHGTPGGLCSDTAQPGMCVDGQWTCPNGTILPTQCGGTNLPPAP